MQATKPILAAAVLGGLVALAPAQNSAGTASLDLLDIEFSGGNVEQYVKALRRQSGTANIVLMPSARDLELPPFEVRAVDLQSAVQLLGTIVGNDGDVRLDIDRTWAGVDGSVPVFTIAARTGRGGRQSGAPQQSIVIAVQDVLDADIEAEAILTALEAALQLLASEHEPAKIRFHEGTGILLARGHPEQMRVISEVIEQVRRNASVRMHERDREAEIEMRMNDLEREATREIQMLEDRLHRLEQENVRLSDELASKTSLVENLMLRVRATEGGGG